MSSSSKDKGVVGVEKEEEEEDDDGDDDDEEEDDGDDDDEEEDDDVFSQPKTLFLNKLPSMPRKERNILRKWCRWVWWW